MATIRTTQDKMRAYFRSLERLAEQNPHEVFVIADKRALHEQARDMGVEFVVGKKEKKKKKKVIAKSEPELFIFEKAKKGEMKPGHKYLRRYQSPAGNWVYEYREDRPEFRPKAPEVPSFPRRGALETLPPFKGPAFRTASGYTHPRGTTAADVVRYEQEEVGNPLGVPQHIISELQRHPAQNLMWVGKTRKTAERYGPDVEKLDLQNPVVIAKDEEGGFLVLHNREGVQKEQEASVYAQKYERAVSDLPKTFRDWVAPDVKKEGDAYLKGEKATGYNINSYDVADAGTYSFLMSNKKLLVMYHNYATQVDHGRDVLKKLHENGIDAPYAVVKRASAVWYPEGQEWTIDPEQEIVSAPVGEKRHRIIYSSDYTIAFLPKNEEEAEKINDILSKHAKAPEKGQPPIEEMIPGSWVTPDRRASKKIDAFERRFLNVKRMGSLELNILTKGKHIKGGGFKQFHTWVNPELAGYILKSQESIWIDSEALW